MADTTVEIGTPAVAVKMRDNGDSTYSAAYPSTAGTETLQVSAASVAAAAWSVLDATATNGKRWAKFRILCNKAHTVEFYGAAADFATKATGAKLKDYTSSGNADNSDSLGDVYYVPCAGLAYIAARVQNNDAAAAATVSVGVIVYD